MTNQELNRHLELVQQLDHCRELLATLEAAASPRAQKLDGMPHAPGIRDGVGDLAAEIADTKAEIECLQAEIARSEAAAAAWIGTIEDMQTRIIFRLRYARSLMTYPLCVSRSRYKYNTNLLKLLLGTPLIFILTSIPHRCIIIDRLWGILFSFW